MNNKRICPVTTEADKRLITDNSDTTAISQLVQETELRNVSLKHKFTSNSFRNDDTCPSIITEDHELLNSPERKQTEIGRFWTNMKSYKRSREVKKDEL